MKKRGAIAAAVLLLLAVAATVSSTSERMASRNIGCDAFQDRALEICARISSEMTWTWFGHATLSPGYRLTLGNLKDVWCKAGITVNDRQDIENIREKSKDWRLEAAADNLISLLRGLDGSGINSVFHPKNPDYLLKDACG